MQYNCKECGMTLESVSGLPGFEEKCPGCGCINTYEQWLTSAQATQEPAETLVLDYAKVDQKTIEYAGFWIRFGAVFVDGITLFIFALIVNKLVNIAGVGGTHTLGPKPYSASTGLGIILGFVPGLVAFLYITIMISSGWQATLGKRAASVMVTDKNFNRISFLRSVGRYFAPMLLYIPAIIFGISVAILAWSSAALPSAYMIIYIVLWFLPLAGYIMAAFDSKKRAFHDRIAGTYVIRGRVEDMADGQSSGMSDV